MQARLEKFNIAVDEDEVAAALLTPATLLPGVLFVHGWGDSKEHDLTRARQMAGLGCASLTFDLRGHAGSSHRQESVTREHNLRDLLAAYDKLLALGRVDPASVAVVGISYGDEAIGLGQSPLVAIGYLGIGGLLFGCAKYATVAPKLAE